MLTAKRAGSLVGLVLALFGGVMLADTANQRCGNSNGGPNATCPQECINNSDGTSSYYPPMLNGPFHVCEPALHCTCPPMQYRGVNCYYYPYPQLNCQRNPAALTASAQNTCQ
jgi:hypothetical protein